jgi:hypothetical protein
MTLWRGTLLRAETTLPFLIYRYITKFLCRIYKLLWNAKKGYIAKKLFTTI